VDRSLGPRASVWHPYEVHLVLLPDPWSTMSFSARQQFPCAPASAGAARAFVTDAVRGFDIDIDIVRLLVSELAANAIRHAGSSFEVSVRSMPDTVRVEVSDLSTVEPMPGAVVDEGGFGLDIVGALSHTWGVIRGDDGKAVWFEVPAVVRAPDAAARPTAATGPSSRGRHAAELPTYSIGVVSALLGVEPSTLRAWEQRYRVVTPLRSSGGHRLYSRDQVDQLRFVVAQMAEGMTAANAHRILEQRSDAVVFVPADPAMSMVVLVAERDVYAAEIAEYFLRTEGYDVRVALDGGEAKHLQRQRRPDLVLLELLLPGGSAIRLCRELVADGIPVIAVSSLAMRDAAVDAGASAFLVKPLDALQLVSTVRDLIGSSAFARAATDRATNESTYESTSR